MNQRLLVASSNTGIGLWTSICVAFCNIFGKESIAYKKKQNKVLTAANSSLFSQYRKLAAAGYYLVDYRVTWSGKLAVTVSALAVEGQSGENLIEKHKACPECGAEIEKDMDFCPECGAKLK